MSEWKPDCEERVRTALTIKRFGETDKPLLDIIRELQHNERNS